MSEGFAAALPDFDLLWNFSQPAQTQTKFEELRPQFQKSKNQDLFLQLQTQIARAQGLQKKFDEAEKTLGDVKKNLTEKTPVAEIRYYLEQGRVFNSSKRKDLASAPFLKAFELATTRHQDNFAVDAAHMMGIIESTPAKQMEWNLKALGLAEKSKEEKARNWLGSLYNNMGWTYHDAGQFQQALDIFQKALHFREEKGKTDSIRIAKWAVARALRSLKKYDDALIIQLALEKEHAQNKSSDGYVFEELAELYLAQSKKDLAQKYFALAYDELSKDDWFKDNEAKRLARIKELSLIKTK